MDIYVYIYVYRQKQKARERERRSEINNKKYSQTLQRPPDSGRICVRLDVPGPWHGLAGISHRACFWDTGSTRVHRTYSQDHSFKGFWDLNLNAEILGLWTFWVLLVPGSRVLCKERPRVSQRLSLNRSKPSPATQNPAAHSPKLLEPSLNLERPKPETLTLKRSF